MPLSGAARPAPNRGNEQILIGVDTNVLVRYLAQDDPAQSARATRFFEQEIGAETPGFVSAIVLCELIWVLEGAYGADRDAQAAIVERLLSVAALLVERPEATARAAQVFRTSSADFADCLIAETATASGCGETVTFDRAMARLPGVRRLD